MESAESESNAASTVAASAHWHGSLKIVGVILLIWAFISLGCGILFREFLDATLPSVGGAPFGFWMAQQGSILGFVGLLFAYMLLMNRLDRRSGFIDAATPVDGSQR